jgi:hypothetical protein
MTRSSITRPACEIVCLLALLILSAASGSAGVRRFTYVYEAPTSAPGGLDIESWVTWRTHTPDDHAFDEVDFRHEFEFGITDRLQLAIYVADWNYRDGNSVESTGFEYSDSALEVIYNLTNPVTDPVGLSLYQEIKAGDRLVELESKIIAQKNFGPLILAYNATLEAVWEGEELAESEGEVQQALGASYELSPRFSVGLELLHELVFLEWSGDKQASNFFVGPNVSVRSGRIFVTMTALAQASRTGDEPDFQMRTIFGVLF